MNFQTENFVKPHLEEAAGNNRNPDVEEQIEEVGEFLTSDSDEVSPGENLKSAIDNGLDPQSTFYIAGMKTHEAINERYDNSDLPEKGLEKLGMSLARAVDEERKGSWEKASERYHPLSVMEDFAVSAVKSLYEDKDMVQISRERRETPDSDIYGATPESCVEAFIQGYQNTVESYPQEQESLQEEYKIPAPS